MPRPEPSATGPTPASGRSGSRTAGSTGIDAEVLDLTERDPDASGYNFWLSKLNSFGGDFVRAEMVNAFISSAEYRARFGPN